MTTMNIWANLEQKSTPSNMSSLITQPLFGQKVFYSQKRWHQQREERQRVGIKHCPWHTLLFQLLTILRLTRLQPILDPGPAGVYVRQLEPGPWDGLDPVCQLGRATGLLSLQDCLKIKPLKQAREKQSVFLIFSTKSPHPRWKLPLQTEGKDFPQMQVHI